MLKRLIIPAVLVLTLGCCTKIVQQSGPVDNTEISYQVISGRTKAPLEAYPTTVPFVSSAWYLPQGKKWDANKADAQLYISSAVISYDDATNRFKAETPYYWPKKGSLTFMAYSLKSDMAYSPEPNKIKITKDNGVVITDWATNGSDKRIDLMVADIVKDKSANGTSYGMVGVPIVFRHILSKVAVTAFIEKEEPGKEIFMNKIIFHNVYGKADFNGSEWTNRGYVHDVNVDHTLTPIKLGIDKTNIIETMLLIPQSLSSIGTRGNVEMVIYYTIKDNGVSKNENVTISLNKHGAAWERGKYTEYQIIFGTSDHPIDFGGSVSDWTDYGNTDIVIGG